MKFCSECGHTVSQKIPDGDNRQRFVCDQCDVIHYQNPKVVVGCLAQWEDQILLCKRAIQPRHGLWTLPAGFMENAESSADGAIRETWEEARAQVSQHSLYALYSIPHISQVYLLYRCQLDNLAFEPGPESLEVALFSEADIPWTELAFPVVKETLKHFFADQKTGDYALHEGILRRKKAR